MKDFYKLLYGLLDTKKLCDALYLDVSRTYYDAEGNITGISADPIFLNGIQSTIYGFRRNDLTDEQWDRLLCVLRKDTFKKIITEFISSFTITKDISEFLEYSFGIPREKTQKMNAQKNNITFAFFFNTAQDENGTAIKLCEITMPMLVHIVLDPCITALITTYYDALLNFIRSAVSTNKTSFFHTIGCCSPWLEEVFDVAFKDVFGENAGKCCRLSSEYQCDDYPTPAVVLKSSLSVDFTEPEINEQDIDNSIVLMDSQDENVSGSNNHLYAWRNRVGALADVPRESKATRLVYIDSCYGYSFDTSVFQDGKALYSPSDSRITTYENIASKYCWDYLRVPFYTVPRVHANSAEELFELLCTMKCLGCVFRGQTSEYFLNRSPKLMKRLYGEETAKEPSLASYALRNGDYFENHYAEWAYIIKEYLSFWIGADETAEMIGQMDVANFYMFCLAVAQHYGLPTFGLDVSGSIATALFFSLFEFHSKTAANGKSQYTRKESGESIIYLFKPKSPEMFDFSRFDHFNSRYQLFYRPLAQSASFAHASWGMARNSIAERLQFAIHFDVRDIDYEAINRLLKTSNFPPLEVHSFFPENDPFILYLRYKYLSDDWPKDSYPHVSKYIEYMKKYIYQVE